MTTPTGIPVTLCDTCCHTHPATRRHCLTCGIASAYLDDAGYCLSHRREPAVTLEPDLFEDAS